MATDAFKAYDFDGDERWQKYFSSVEVPHGDKAVIVERLKRKWFQKNVDLSYGAAHEGKPPGKPAPAFGGNGGNGASEHASASANLASAAEPSSPPPPPPPRAGLTARWLPSAEGVKAWLHGACSRSAAAARGVAQGGLGGAGRGLQRGLGRSPAGLLFAAHLLQLLLALGVLLPVRAWGARPWQLFQLAAFAAHGTKTVLKYGVPQRSMPALQAYAASVTPSTDFQYMLMALMLLASRPMALAIVPSATLALYHAMAYLAGKLGHTRLWQSTGGRLHAWLLARQAKALEMCACAEVATGFVLVLMLLTAHRSILLTFYYWKNFLPMRYWSPDSAACHRQAWAIVHLYTAPVLRAVPFLNVAVRYVSRWFIPPQ